MGFLQRLFGFFRGGSRSADGRTLPIYVLSRRCNEPIAGQIDLYNELSLGEGSDDEYYARKVLHTSGNRRCFDQVEVHLYFDANKRLLRHEVEGGRWLDEAEYERERELARMQAEDAAREAAARAASEQGDAGQAATGQAASEQADAEPASSPDEPSAGSAEERGA